MELLTQHDLNIIPDLYETENTKMDEKIVYAKFFTPDSSWTWYLIELSKENNDLAFGYVIGDEKEFGYWSMSELQEVQGPLGLLVERDTSFQPSEFKNIRQL
ncbi:MAG: DUF2958 domain-containing protein [Campylobacterota bacterium]|nr:DUF2958 domain-containing protein [Campylobacterota bacterium]